jgi:hypothetical protein
MALNVITRTVTEKRSAAVFMQRGQRRTPRSLGEGMAALSENSLRPPTRLERIYGHLGSVYLTSAYELPLWLARPSGLFMKTSAAARFRTTASGIPQHHTEIADVAEGPRFLKRAVI